MESRKTRAEQIQESRKDIQKQRNQSRNTGTGKSFLEAKRKTATGRLK